MEINQITLPCIDYAASVKFYQQLGLVQIVDAPPRYARFESQTGHGSTLSIHNVADLSPSPTVVYFDHASAKALDTRVRQLKDKGVRFISGPRDENWGWREARLHDPAGNQLCLMFAGTIRRFPDWRLDGRKA
ncbi:MAG: VOC family protein [Pseudomonadota bacterium]